jgi:glutathione reductase (NADPH)
MAEFDVDLFVIGGGSGGVRAARIAAGHGARVMIAEEYRMGGTCVIRGCVPKKLLVYASHIHHEIADAAGFGWTIPSATFDWATLTANKDKEIARLEAAYTANVEKSGARIVKTRAVFEDAHTLRLLTGETVKAKNVLIATGGAPNHGDPIPGIEHVISSNEAFHLNELPKRIVIQGGGYIALEFACIFAGFGSDVTLVYRGQNILRGFDDDVRSHVRAEMEKEGITILTGNTVSKVDRHGKEFTTHLSNGSSIASDQVMFAIGRHPNVANLGIEKVGVAINPANGGITVDSFSRTSVPNIYAIGDVTHRLNLTPVAIREGHAFADTVFGKRSVEVDHLDIPTAVFSQPEIGTVGLTEAQARAVQPRRYLQGQLQADQGDAVGPRHARADEADRGCLHRPHRRLPHGRRRRRRNHSGARHRREDESDQGRFRRDHGAASDRGGRTGDDADTDVAACEGSGGVGAADGWELPPFAISP